MNLVTDAKIDAKHCYICIEHEMLKTNVLNIVYSIMKCCHEINRENANRGNHVINNIQIDSLINHTCLSPNVFFNCLFYGRYYPSLSAMHCLSHSLSFCLSAVLLSSPFRLFDIKTLASISSSSFIAINCFDTHRCFT